MALKERFLFVSLLLMVQSLAASCSAENASLGSSRTRFALLAECESSAKEFLTSLSAKRPDISFHIEKFDKILGSHPSIVGYIEIVSNIEDYEGLENIVNRITYDCYPEAVSKIPVDQNLGSGILNILNINNRIGIKNTYFVFDGDTMKAFYHDKAVPFEKER